jgi:beta-1,2-mannosidase
VVWSLNLLDWNVVEDENGDAIEVLPSRPNTFDAGLAEAACPGVVTEQGIVVFYNGKNGINNDGDLSLKPGTYSGAQALFSLEDPTKLLQRSTTLFFIPERKWETSGQYTAGTTFIEGLVLFKGKYFMYYGAADSFVGVAVANQVKME